MFLVLKINKQQKFDNKKYNNMNQKLEESSKQNMKFSSKFFQQMPVDQNKSLKETTDIPFYISCLRQRFGIDQNKPHQAHNGDIQISYQTILDEMNQSFKEVNNNNLVLNKTFQPLTQSTQLKDEHVNCQPQSKYSLFEQECRKVQPFEDQKNESSFNQDIANQQHKLQSQEKECSDIFEQTQQVSLDSKIIAPLSEFKKSSTNTEQKSNYPYKRSQTLIQDEIIYEKNLKKLGTKVNTMLKSQYQNQKEFNFEQKYKQNFENGRNIISRLLNNSMNKIMRIRQNVQNFVEILKIRHSNRRLCDLSEKEYQIVNDLSYFYSQKKIKNGQILKVFVFLLRILKYSKQIAIFMPTDTFRVTWDVVQVAFTYIFFYFYSIIIFFDEESIQTGFTQKISFYAFIIFLFDILISLNTAYFDKDAIITQRKLIAKQYFLSSIFITDLISMLVLASKIIYSNSLISNNINHNLFIFVLNLLIFLKANGISHKKKRFDYIFTLTENQKHVGKLINQLASVITVAHIASIGWYFLGTQEQNNVDYINWLDKIGISSYPYYQKYIYSLYWSITTMTTVGYGDISAQNPIEALYITIAMILFSCVFAYSINNIGFILQEIERSSKQLNDDLTTIQRYLKRKEVNIQLKSRVRHYLSFLAQEQKDRDKQQEDKILSSLSNKLRDEITQEINSKILNSYFIFSSNFSQSTINKLVYIMKEILVNPNEIIICEDKCDDSSIFFIQNGIIEIFQQKIQKSNSVNVIKTLKEGQVFGEISFFSGLQRQASARSVNLSTLYKINREEFIEILRENPEDFERFKMMQDQIIFQKEVSITHSECYNCKNTSHLVKDCPRTHKYFDKQFIILKQKFSIFQERVFQQRIYFKNKIKFKNQYRKNQEVIQKLKYNLLQENDEKYLMFTQDENILTECTSSQYENDEDDEEYDNDCKNEELSQIQIPQIFDEKTNEITQSIQKKPQQYDKIEKQVKSINNVNSGIINTEEIEQIANLENQIQSFHTNLVYENQEFTKTFSNSFNSQAKVRSFEATDFIDTCNVQENINMISQKSQNKVFYKRDTATEIQQQCLVNQDDEDDRSTQNNSKKFDKQKQAQANINVQLTDYLKSQMRQGPCYSNLNNQIQKQFTNQSVDDHSQSQYQDNQVQKTNKKEYIQRKSKHNRLTKVKKESIKNNQQTNQSQKEFRCSVEQMLLQNIISMTLMQDKRSSLLQQKIYEVSQDKVGCINSLNGHSFENIEKKSIQQISNKSSKLHQRDSSQNIQQKQQQQMNQVNTNTNENQQLIERFSKLIYESQLPLLLQMTTGKSFLQDSQFIQQNSMDYFDRMQNFKKFYPKNNFDQVLNNIKTLQQEQKKQKKKKLATKERRQNICLGNEVKISIFQGNNTNFIRLIKQDYDINQYKPTYLSYGTKMQKGVNFPINIIYKNYN
ncbi:cation channel family protein (macronuclear) [Tetrahymena thermophila SB210]|uniref:Cation channel family protein n=1 Tax=Tetrahymena thermophila (strain SB210) TaxID=312017 RepID=Q23JK0_TETTS|nr:cation channel family protein [Tetrahymena thermophila SB210]EAR96743.3 cation channel family protein [Tetrahymena thermophila SB210]|eukprot:XP_001016988.3 cation channel family protein [Tetrahymena thermophila SB210]